jgi:hypothetical protein
MIGIDALLDWIDLSLIVRILIGDSGMCGAVGFDLIPSKNDNSSHYNSSNDRTSNYSANGD